MIRTLRLIGIHAHRTFLEWMTWRGFLITIVIGQCVTPVLGLAVWSAALPGSESVSAYYLALLLVQLTTVSQLNHMLSNGIYDGSMSHDLVKPQPPILVTIGATCAAHVWYVLIGMPVVAILWLLTGVAFRLGPVLQATPALLLAVMLRFLFSYMLALSAFWTQQAHGAFGFGEVLIFLIGGSAAPIAFFPDATRDVVAILPFRAMLGLPAEIATGSLDRREILIGYAWQIAWLGVFVALAAVVWRLGVRRFTAIGG